MSFIALLQARGGGG
uniref:Truncated ecdysteroid UDP-glucosyltransferase n=2 Tax=Antheraea pernyi nuclear polyhedrosis virus TaxID=161494 RepID=A0A1V1FYA9_NPVAP|nr:truncated ecdysteroid UDP-glucosyltransferase [Antheraea pernyi nucleopolyhedrovirus]BBD50899.1 truncated ecdysteroid UDP-glucosyltransferase [Antheraea proylei nucleopolyhedrovirus]